MAFKHWFKTTFWQAINASLLYSARGLLQTLSITFAASALYFQKSQALPISLAGLEGLSELLTYFAIPIAYRPTEETLSQLLLAHAARLNDLCHEKIASLSAFEDLTLDPHSSESSGHDGLARSLLENRSEQAVQPQLATLKGRTERITQQLEATRQRYTSATHRRGIRKNTVYGLAFVCVLIALVFNEYLASLNQDDEKTNSKSNKFDYLLALKITVPVLAVTGIALSTWKQWRAGDLKLTLAQQIQALATCYEQLEHLSQDEPEREALITLKTHVVSVKRIDEDNSRLSRALITLLESLQKSIKKNLDPTRTAFEVSTRDLERNINQFLRTCTEKELESEADKGLSSNIEPIKRCFAELQQLLENTISDGRKLVGCYRHLNEEACQRIGSWLSDNGLLSDSLAALFSASIESVSSKDEQMDWAARATSYQNRLQEQMSIQLNNHWQKFIDAVTQYGKIEEFTTSQSHDNFTELRNFLFKKNSNCHTYKQKLVEQNSLFDLLKTTYTLADEMSTRRIYLSSLFFSVECSEDAPPFQVEGQRVMSFS